MNALVLAIKPTSITSEDIHKPKPDSTGHAHGLSVRTAHTSVLVTRTTVVHDTAQNSSDNLPSDPPDNYLSLLSTSDVVLEVKVLVSRRLEDKNQSLGLGSWSSGEQSWFWSCS